MALRIKVLDKPHLLHEVVMTFKIDLPFLWKMTLSYIVYICQTDMNSVLVGGYSILTYMNYNIFCK